MKFPKFISPDQLPEPLRSAVLSFIPVGIEENYRDDHDVGYCFIATEHFISMLEEHGYEPYTGVDYFDCRSHKFSDPENDPSFPYVNGDYAKWHYVAVVDGYAIDWTARQFYHGLPYPAIWSLEDWPLVREEEEEAA